MDSSAPINQTCPLCGLATTTVRCASCKVQIAQAASLLTSLRTIISTVCEIPAEQITCQTELWELLVDSIQFVEFMVAFEQETKNFSLPNLGPEEFQDLPIHEIVRRVCKEHV